MKENRMNRRQFVHTAAMAAAGTTIGAGVIEKAAGAEVAAPNPTRTRSYNENMEYRRLGRTGLMVSAVSIGGHWKQMPFAHGSEDFKKNRREVMAACIDHGINYADPCGAGEVLVYAEALGKNRDKIYFGFDWWGARSPEIAGSLDKMKQQLDQGLRYVLGCDVLSCAIPGLITVDQVKNAAAAVKERRQFDVAEAERFDALVAETWANLPENYQWLRHWEWV
ncbi:MAG: hypothetical protein ABSH34_13565 [Verrucomicrobiota bacterium]|jgi:hypothetical protein